MPGLMLHASRSSTSAAHDKLDFSDIVTKGFEDGTPGLGLTAASGRIYIATAQQDMICNSLASLKAAAEFVAANDGGPAARTCDVFEYKGSTYLFDDANGSGVMTAGAASADGLIKLVGVVGVSLANFA
jgi:hypothetical protein